MKAGSFEGEVVQEFEQVNIDVVVQVWVSLESHLGNGILVLILKESTNRNHDFLHLFPLRLLGSNLLLQQFFSRRGSSSFLLKGRVIVILTLRSVSWSSSKRILARAKRFLKVVAISNESLIGEIMLHLLLLSSLCLELLLFTL